MKSFPRNINVKLRIFSELPSLGPGEKRDVTQPLAVITPVYMSRLLMWHAP